MSTFTWTPEIVERASTLYAAGQHSAAQIGNIIGTSKGSVIGKMDRLGIRTPRTRADNAPPQPRAERRKPPQAAKPPLPVIVPVAPPQPLVRLVSHGKTIVNLLPRECRWPVSQTNSGTHLFCAGHVENGGPYCARCSGLAYTVTKPRIGQNPTAGRRFA